MQATPVPASKQVDQLKTQLLEAFVQRQAAEDTVKACDDRIRAIRNVLAGIPLGQQLERETPPPAAPAA